VPRNNQAPLTFSGARSTARHWVQSSIDKGYVIGPALASWSSFATDRR
jgi:hypothetical protein